MISLPFPKIRSPRFDAPIVEVLPGAIHDPSSVLLPLGGHRVLPHDDLQARAQSDSHSFHYRWLTRDTSGHGYRSYVQSASGPCQLGRL